MDDARDGRAAAVVDVGHRAGDGARGRDAAEERRQQVGGALRDELGVGVVAVVDHAVGHRRRQKRFDGAQDGDGDSHGEEVADRLPVDGRKGGGRQFGMDGEAVADGVDALDPGIGAQEPHGEGHHHDRHERPGNAAHDARREGDQQDARNAHRHLPAVHRTEMAEIEHPLPGKIARNGLTPEVEPEEVGDLRGEDRHGDTAREAHDDRIGDELDDRAQPAKSHDQQQDAAHERSDEQSRFAVLLDDAVDDDDEGARGASDLHAAAAQQRDDESGDNGGDDALFGRHARGDAEGDGQRQGDDADNDAGHQVAQEIRAGIVLQRIEELGSE